MKLWGVFRFELAYQLRRHWAWSIFAVVLVLSFLMARDTSLADALYEDFFANSSFAVARSTVVGGLVWLLLAPAVAGEAAARDVATRMAPLVYAAPVRKAEYLGGRFLAALALNAVLLLAVQAGILLGVYSPGVDAAVLGPFRPAVFLTAYAFVALPNAFVATALQFALASRSGRPMASYLASLLLVVVGFFVASYLRFFVRADLGTLLDPIGIQFIVEDLSHSWTTVEKSSRLLALEGALLTNRLLWLGVGAGALAVTYARFRFAHRTTSNWRERLRLRRTRANAGTPPAVRSPTAVVVVRPPSAGRDFGRALHLRQTLAIAWDSFRTIATSWAGLAVLIVIPAMAVPVVLSQMSAVGTPLAPATARVLAELTGGLTAELAAQPSRWVIVPLFLVFFAGELVWRERDAGVSEIVDAMPGSDWVPLLGKLLGLGLLLVAFLAMLAVAGMVAQAITGYRHFELGLYLKVLFGFQLAEYFLFALLALVVHVVVGQKYVGHVVAVLAYAFIAVLARSLGVEHHLLVYDRGPGWSYTEMRGFGGSVGPWSWFKLYWAAWGVLLAVAARLLWARGRETGLRVRLRSARRRLTRPTAATAAVGAGGVVTLGSFIFYNTNVLNAYRSAAAREELRAEYERRYRRYERVPQPRMTAARLRVELYPARRAASIRGAYRLVNDGAAPVDSVHVATAAGGVETRAVTFDRPATLALDDEARGYRIYALARPLAPGDSLRLDFEVRVARHGFGNRGVDPSVSPKSSAFSSEAWLPLVGYQRGREILGAAARRAHGLEPRALLASLYEVEGAEPTSRGGGIAFEAVVGTEAGQVAVAPGALRRTWREGGRRYFDYATSAPIGSRWDFFSADYAVREGRWNEVAIRIFHDPRHTAHLDRTMRSVRASLDVYTRQFGPYPYRHLTVVEHPGAPGAGMHAEPGVISHGEAVPFWVPKGESSLDFPSAVVAHEMGHQWTPPYALAEGLPFLSEGLAWYSAMQVVRASRGDEELRRLLAFMRRPYPFQPIRRGEPLLRALDPYQAYRKGPFAMHALSEYLGADRVNGAIRRLVARSDSAEASPVTTLDLYRELQAVTPDSLRYLLHDLFEVNTLWQLETKCATAVETGTGTWRVTLDVRARKIVYDSAGVETEAGMDEWVPVGVFGAAERDAGELSALLYVQMHRVRAGAQTLTVTVPRKPVLAGVDPYHLLDWEEREDDDNIVPVKVGR